MKTAKTNIKNSTNTQITHKFSESKANTWNSKRRYR